MSAPALRVLHAIHDFLPRHRAGSEIYAAALCKEQQRQHHVTLLAAEHDPGEEHGSLRWRMHDGLPVVELYNNWSFDSFAETYASPQLERVLAHALRAVDPDVVHVHNLLNLSFGLPRLAHRRGAVVVATLHDYTLFCPSGGQRLHRAERHVCHQIEPGRCSRCFHESPWHSQWQFGRALLGGAARPRLASAIRALKRRAPALTARWGGAALAALPPRPVTAADIDRRLAAARQVLAEIDWFVAPSRSLGEEYVALGLPRGKLEVRDYGFPARDAVLRTDASSTLRVGFVGALVWHKGVHVLLEAARRLPADRIAVEIFGDPAVAPEYSAELERAARDLPVRFRGGFGDDAGLQAFAGFDVLVVPSLWLENSPLVIHEAFQAGIPVVGSRIGGIPDLVKHGENGLLFEPGSAEALAGELQRLLDDEAVLRRLARVRTPVASLSEDAEAWTATYHRLLAQPASVNRAAP